MSRCKLEKTSLLDLPENVLENIILYVAPSRIQLINEWNFGKEVHALSQCCLYLNKIVNRSRLNATALSSSGALRRLLRYADKHKCNWILESIGIPGVVDIDVADFDHFICLLNENPHWIRGTDVMIRLLTISSSLLSEQTKTLICTCSQLTDRLFLDVLCHRAEDIRNCEFLVSYPYYSLLTKIFIHGASTKDNKLGVLNSFTNLECINLAEDSIDLRDIRNPSIVTDISAQSISIGGSSGMSLPKFINVYDLRFESGQKSDFLAICQCFPNLRNLDMSKLVLEEKRNLKDALAILPQKCSSMHIKLDMLPILSRCCQLKFLLITDDHIHTSYNDEALVSASIIWSSFQFSLLAVTIDCNIFEGSKGLDYLKMVLFLQPTLLVVCILVKPGVTTPKVLQDWLGNNSELIEALGVELIRSMECRQFDSSSDQIIYMKPTVSFRTVHLISYLKKNCQWPISSRLILNDTEMKSLKTIGTEKTELVKKACSIL